MKQTVFKRISLTGVFWGESCWEGLYWEALEAGWGAKPSGCEWGGGGKDRFNPGWLLKKVGAPAAATCCIAPFKMKDKEISYEEKKTCRLNTRKYFAFLKKWKNICKESIERNSK